MKVLYSPRFWNYRFETRFCKSLRFQESPICFSSHLTPCIYFQREWRAMRSFFKQWVLTGYLLSYGIVLNSGGEWWLRWAQVQDSWYFSDEMRKKGHDSNCNNRATVEFSQNAPRFFSCKKPWSVFMYHWFNNIQNFWNIEKVLHWMHISFGRLI